MSPSFRHVVPLVLLALLIPVIGSQAWFWSVSSDRQVERRLVERARAMGGPLAVAMESAYRKGEAASPRSRMALGAVDRDLVDAMMVDAEGRVIASSDPMLEGRALAAIVGDSLAAAAERTVLLEQIRHRRDADRQQLVVSFPVRVPGENGDFFAQRIGALTLLFDTSRVSHEVEREALLQFGIGAGIYLGGVALLWLWFQRALLARVRRVVDGVDLLRRGRLDARIGMENGDEISVIARAVDEMAAVLDTNMRALQRSGAELRSLLAQRERLLERVRELSHRLSRSTENERRRIARDLHDDLGQDITALRYLLEYLRLELREVDDGSLRGALGELGRISRDMNDKVRRMLVMLRPGVLDELGVVAALESMAHHLEPVTEARIDVRGNERRLHPVIEIELFRIAQEALNNAVKHAGASRISVGLRAEDSGYLLEVEDDGRGFDPTAIEEESGGESWGLIGMRERARAIGARMEIDSAPGHGTVVRIRGADQEELVPSAAASGGGR